MTESETVGPGPTSYRQLVDGDGLVLSLARWHPLTVHDGVISVDAAFTPEELRLLAPRARVRSHWPWFRLSLEINVSRSQ